MVYIVRLAGFIVAVIIGFIGITLYIPSMLLYRISSWLMDLSVDILDLIQE